MIAKNGHKYRVYFLINSIVPQEGSIEQYYVDIPKNEDVIEDILMERPWLENLKSNIKVLKFEPIL